MPLNLNLPQGYIRLATWQFFFTEYRKTTKKRSENKKNLKFFEKIKKHVILKEKLIVI